jgi:O-methyltransferase involved in polyketide biosynthesis
MYLERRDIDATLRVLQARSALGSRLIIAYHQPALMLLVAAVIVRRLGEPIRTVLTPRQMRQLLEHHGFDVQLDEDLSSIGARLSSEVAKATRIMKHLRIVTADRERTRQRSH